MYDIRSDGWLLLTKESGRWTIIYLFSFFSKRIIFNRFIGRLVGYYLTIVLGSLGRLNGWLENGPGEIPGIVKEYLTCLRG